MQILIFKQTTGDMLSHSLPSTLNRSLNGEMGLLPGLDSTGQFSCVYCSFASSSLDEINAHRWEVHPLLARRKQHLVTSSPQNRRKRPNSESSEDGKDNGAEDGAPRKKASPRHLPVMSCDASESASSEAEEFLLRSCSDDETNAECPETVVATSTHYFATSGFCDINKQDARSSSLDKCRNDCSRSSIRTQSRVEFELNRGIEDTSDLHTLAKAAVNADPMPQKSFSNPSAKFLIPAQIWRDGDGPAYFSNNYRTNLTSDYSTENIKSYPNQYSSNPLVFARDHFLDKYSVSFHPSQVSFPPVISITAPPSQLPFCLSKATVTQNIFNSKDKLSTLSKVACEVLKESSKEVSRSQPKVNTNHQTIQNALLTQYEQNKPLDVCHGPPKTCEQAQHVITNKSYRQYVEERKQTMDEDRVRSLEQALSKIDCCDPEERTNVLPYKCPDGKWRMVRTKCVGGAWLVHVPGAVKPSVYLPLQRKHKSTGILDDWLKDKLLTNGSNRSNPNTRLNNDNISHQRPCAADAVVISSASKQSGINHGNTKLCGGAIKSLLLQNAAT